MFSRTPCRQKKKTSTKKILTKKKSNIRKTPVKAKKTTKKKTNIFPRDFLWGASSWSLLLDGGDPESDWEEYMQARATLAGGVITTSAHWNHYEKDFKLMKSMGLNAYRLTLDWSRIQPAPDKFNLEAIDHLRHMLDSLNRKKIRPLLVLNQFSLPLWWQARGGWSREENLGDFYYFVNSVVGNLGDLVHEYITTFEPVTYAYQGYMLGNRPPRADNWKGYFNSIKVLRNMLTAHFNTYQSIHNNHHRLNYKPPRVSIASNFQYLLPLNPGSKLDRDRLSRADTFFNYLTGDCLQSGKLLYPLGKNQKLHEGRALDFISLNYGGRRFVGFDWRSPSRLFMSLSEGGHESEKAEEPHGLEYFLQTLYSRYGLPMRVTTGPGPDQKNLSAYLKGHLGAVGNSLKKGIPVEGFYYRSLMDNKLWPPEFRNTPLLEKDQDQRTRTLSKSGLEFQKIIKSGVL